MNEYINQSDALDILDQLEDAIENGELRFYSTARAMMGDLPTEKIIHCKDCINFYNNHLCLHWSKHGTIEVRPNDFCSMARLKE